MTQYAQGDGFYFDEPQPSDPVVPADPPHEIEGWLAERDKIVDEFGEDMADLIPPPMYSWLPQRNCDLGTLHPRHLNEGGRTYCGGIEPKCSDPLGIGHLRLFRNPGGFDGHHH